MRRLSSEGRVVQRAWLTRGVVAIGLASLFSDLGHEMTTALLPAFLVGTLAAPAIALGLIEGVADGVSALFKFAGGYASDAAAGTERGRRVLGAGGYLVTALSTGLIGLARTWPGVLVLRTLAWSGRGFRGPIRDALLADQVDRAAYGRAYGFERAMDSVGAIGAPLLASALLVAVGMRPTLLLAALPGLVAVALFLFFVREERHVAASDTRVGVRATLRALPRPFQRLLVSVGAFGVGNFAATFFILRATTVLVGPYGAVRGAALAVGLYTLYNVVYAASAYVAGEAADRVPKPLVLGAGYTLFFVTCVGFVWVGANLVALAVLFAIAGAHVGLVETAQSAYAAELLPEALRGTGFGTLAAVNGVGDTVSSITVGVLWTVVAPQAGFIFGAAFAVIALLTLTALRASAVG
jgi:MFS family permease